MPAERRRLELHDLTPLPPISSDEVSKWDLRPRPPPRADRSGRYIAQPHQALLSPSLADGANNKSPLPPSTAVDPRIVGVPANNKSPLPRARPQAALGDGLRRSRSRVAPEQAQGVKIRTEASERKSGKVWKKLDPASWFEAQLAVQAASGVHH
jgi:hypothetical protein